jgi:hypothetical protein
VDLDEVGGISTGVSTGTPKGQAALLKRLLEVTSPDFIEDKGHYYGHQLSDEVKRALIEYMKYF